MPEYYMSIISIHAIPGDKMTYDDEKIIRDEKQRYAACRGHNPRERCHDHDAYWAARETREQYDRFVPVYP